MKKVQNLHILVANFNRKYKRQIFLATDVSQKAQSEESVLQIHNILRKSNPPLGGALSPQG